MSLTWAIALTVVFAVTGGYSFLRWVRLTAAPRPDQDRLIDLNHVVMSVAMLIMVWWPVGTVGTVVQIVVFSALGLIFVGRAVAGDHLGHAGGGRLGSIAHAAMNLAMVWMLAAMPMLMGGATAAPGGGHAGHAGHTAEPGAAGMVVAEAPGWVIPINQAAIAVMIGVAVWWLVHAVRTERHRSHLCCHTAMGAGMALMLAVMH